MAMARVRGIPSSELPSDLAAIYERFAGRYGPFRNQAAMFAHVPAALRHLMAMLLELREAATLPNASSNWQSSPSPSLTSARIA
jgi:hypothetical protein